MTAKFDIESCSRAVQKYLFSLCGDFHIAEELTQETIVKICEHRCQVEQMQYPKAWVFRVASNLWFDRVRSSKRHPGSTDQTHSLVCRTKSPPAAFALKEEYEHVLATFQQLPPTQRQVLFLRAVEELSICEIATVLETTRNNVTTHLSLARKAMRRILAPSKETNNA